MAPGVRRPFTPLSRNLQEDGDPAFQPAQAFLLACRTHCHHQPVPETHVYSDLPLTKSLTEYEVQELSIPQKMCSLRKLEALWDL